MNYNDIKNLNISKRGKKELLNALNKGGGSGAGVTIVDSVDKLDKNAPVGTPAVVAVGGGSKYQTFSELCAMVPPFNLGPDTSQEETIEILKKLPIITDIKFNIPKKLLPSEVQGVLGLIPFEVIESENMQLNDMMMIVVGSEVVAAAAQINGETPVQLKIMTFNTETQTYELDKLAVQEFNRVFKLKTWAFLGKDFLSELMGELTPESIAAMDEVFSLLAGAVAQAELYIKKEEWQKVLIEDIEAIYTKLDTKSNIITKSSLNWRNELKPNIYYTKQLNSSEDFTIRLLNYNESSNYDEYILELIIGDSAPSNLIIEDSDNAILNIKWANNISPIFSPNTTYIISISNVYAVFAQFTNE